MRRTYAPPAVGSRGLNQTSEKQFLSCKRKITNLPRSHLTYVNVGRAKSSVMKLGLHASRVARALTGTSNMVVQEDTLPSRVNAADGAETMSPQANDALDFDLYQGSLWEKY